MNKMKVTIVVPVYGVEAYLDACVESIVTQTYPDLEIFLVDDGGTDNCPAMCDEWAKKDNRIIVIHKENGGQGTARNVALDRMTGDYVLFVDSDDRMRPTMVEEMLNATDSGQIDLVLCGYTADNTLRTVDTNWYAQSKLYTTKEILFEYLTAKKIVVAPFCKLISKSLIANIRFPAFRAKEDAHIMHKIFGGCNRAYILNRHLYIQNIRAGSTEQSGFSEKNMHSIDAAYDLQNYVKQNYPEYAVYIKDRIAKSCMGLLDKIYIGNVRDKFPACEERIKSILMDELKKLDHKTKIYKRATLYLNRHFLYVCKVKMQFFKMKLRANVKQALVAIKSSVGHTKRP